MWGIRRQVSLLLEHGHRRPDRYPIGFLHDEVAIVVERLNARIANDAIMTRRAFAAVASVEGCHEFNEMIKNIGRT